MLADGHDSHQRAENQRATIGVMRTTDLGLMSYREAWATQERIHAQVVDGAAERLLLVEHPAVITLGRRSGVDRNLIASADHLARIGVEVVQSDRGGDITFHGPGQVVAYPIVRLNDHRLSVGGYVRKLEAAAIACLSDFDVVARREEGAVGVWTDDLAFGVPAKIGAIGVRIRRGVSLHGIALNVSTDLNFFSLIVPCGLVGRPVTSLVKLLGAAAPASSAVRKSLATRLLQAFGAAPDVESPRPLP